MVKMVYNQKSPEHWKPIGQLCSRETFAVDPPRKLAKTRSTLTEEEHRKKSEDCPHKKRCRHKYCTNRWESPSTGRWSIWSMNWWRHSICGGTSPNSWQRSRIKTSEYVVVFAESVAVSAVPPSNPKGALREPNNATRILFVHLARATTHTKSEPPKPQIMRHEFYGMNHLIIKLALYKQWQFPHNYC